MSGVVPCSCLADAPAPPALTFGAVGTVRKNRCSQDGTTETHVTRNKVSEHARTHTHTRGEERNTLKHGRLSQPLGFPSPLGQVVLVPGPAIHTLPLP